MNLEEINAVVLAFRNQDCILDLERKFVGGFAKQLDDFLCIIRVGRYSTLKTAWFWLDVEILRARNENLNPASFQAQMSVPDCNQIVERLLASDLETAAFAALRASYESPPLQRPILQLLVLATNSLRDARIS